MCSYSIAGPFDDMINVQILPRKQTSLSNAPELLRNDHYQLPSAPPAPTGLVVVISERAREARALWAYHRV